MREVAVWRMITPCPLCGSEESSCGTSEVENTKGEKHGYFMPFVHIERLWHVILRTEPHENASSRPLSATESDE
jgi:hypothetical protein